jgi:Ca2+-binding EF-hand superfamily protein
MKKLLMGGAALALAVPALAQVASAPAPKPQNAAKIHTRADVQAEVAKHFARVDANRDGFVTQAEADAAVEAFRGKRTEKRTERRAERREHAFERIDVNGDGAITKAEWDAKQAKRQERVAARDHDGDGRADRTRAGGHGMSGFGGQMFEMADANKDGRVTLQEAQAAALQHFDRADTNRDGQITREERKQMHQRMRAGGQHG